MTTLRSRHRTEPSNRTPDAHDFPTRPYDLVKEFVIALAVITLLTVIFAAVFSSPDEKAMTLQKWAEAAPADVVATATAELAGTSTSASYGAPYNTAGPGQKLGPLSLQRWAGVRIPIDSANDFVIAPLRSVSGDPVVTAALKAWDSASQDQRQTWATNYSDALAAAPDGNPDAVAPGQYGPVPVLAKGVLTLASSGELEGLLTTKSTFYAGDSTKALLFLADSSYLQDQARAQHLGGDQWGMMNETGNYPGQPWLWLYTFWYQVKPFSSSGNADVLVWGLMAVLSLVLLLLPWIPGLRSLPRYLGVHRLIWRQR
jgi:hypothetical protein